VEKRKFTRFGTFSVAVMLLIFILMLVMMLTAGIADPVQGVIFGLVALMFLIPA
jgi:membrane protein required for beta-lactamase induction